MVDTIIAGQTLFLEGLNPQFRRPGLPPLFVLAAAITTQQQTAGFQLGALSPGIDD